MTKLIAKKIQKSDTDQSNGSYAHALIAYITNPDTAQAPDTDEDHSQSPQEKCVHAEGLNFSREDLTPKEMAQEMKTLCRSTEDSGSMNLISHWCISWKGEAPSQDQIVSAAKDLLSDMGYGPDHLATIGIHTDTENVHVHIAACRVSVADGSILKEGNDWWKLESQRFCARAAHKYGWEQADGARFVATGEIEKIQTTDRFTGKVVERERPVVKNAPKDGTEKPKALRDRTVWQELKTGLRSHLGALQDTMLSLKDQITDKMKWGHVHKLLSEHGAEMKLADHGGSQGLTYSLDGTHWEAGHSIGQEFTLDAMEARLGNKRFRHAKESVHEIAESVRQEMIQMPTQEAEARTPLSREQVDALRKIPIPEVQEKFSLPESENKKIRNGLDVLIVQQKIPYKEAVKKMAEAFPGVISGEDLINTVPTESYKARIAAANIPATLHRTAMDCMKQIDSFGVERFHVYASGDEIGYTSEKKFPQGMTQADLMKELPNLARLNTDKNAHIYFAPVHSENKISIPVDDVHSTLLESHRPSLIFATSDRSQQAHYVIHKKYDNEFYDALTAKINRQYGDPKVTHAAHDTRLAGFTNRKQFKTDDSEEYPFAKIIQHTPLKCTSFEQYVDEQHILWKKNDPSFIVPKKDPQATGKFITNPDKEKLYALLNTVPVPARLSAEASRYQAAISMQYGQGLDRSKADKMIASHMYDIGATSDQVYSWMREYSTQDDTRVTRKHQGGTVYHVNKNPTEEARDRHARRTAVNTAPAKPVPAPIQVSGELYNMITAKRSANTMSNWERKQMQLTNPAPTPAILDSSKDRAIAENDKYLADQAKAEAAKKAEEEAKRRAEAEAKHQAELGAKRKSNPDSGLTLADRVKAARARGVFDHKAGPVHSSAGPTAGSGGHHGPKM